MQLVAYQLAALVPGPRHRLLGLRLQVLGGELVAQRLHIARDSLARLVQVGPQLIAALRSVFFDHVFPLAHCAASLIAMTSCFTLRAVFSGLMSTCWSSRLPFANISPP